MKPNLQLTEKKIIKQFIKIYERYKNNPFLFFNERIENLREKEIRKLEYYLSLLKKFEIQDKLIFNELDLISYINYKNILNSYNDWLIKLIYNLVS